MENKSHIAYKLSAYIRSHLTIVSIIVGACASYRCLNNGICTNVNGAPKCVCIEGYEGDRCEQGKGINQFRLLAPL